MSGRCRPPRGFTLVEIAIVLVVVGVLTRTLLVPLGEHLERRREETTRERLEDVRRALIGHLVTNGVLPCPLDTRGAADEPPDASRDASTDVSTDGASGRPCRRTGGRVPAITLGVTGPVDGDGALLDAWGRPLQYGVSLASADGAGDRTLPDWTTPGELAAVGLERLTADLALCRVAAAGACPRDELRADAVAFVVLSRGADGSGRDAQRGNLDGDTTYTLAPVSTVDGHRFDDLLVWGSRNELAYWLLKAGWLP